MDVADRRLSTVGWWVITFAIVIVLDDLTYGPIFWLLAAFTGSLAVFIAFGVYVAAQLYLVHHGVKDDPGPLARRLLDRLELSRRFDQVANREAALHERVTGSVVAVLLALVIGGVLPPLLLWRRGWSRSAVMRVATVTSVVYAAEFAFLHAFIPSRVL